MIKIELFIHKEDIEIKVGEMRSKAKYNNNPEIVSVGLLKSYFRCLEEIEKQKEV